MVRITKKHIGKYFKVFWKDPTTHCQASLSRVIKEPFSIHDNNGKVVHVDKGIVIIAHDECGDEGDFTAIHPSLIVRVEPV